ncbi:MAG: GC-type dockerin domain-anchored protein [Phycisphaerales bacterium JB061]
MKAITATVVAAIAGAAAADTTEISPSRFLVDEGVTFEIGHLSALDYTFDWTDDSGTITGEVDPTLVLVSGQTYNFIRTSGSHPLVICNDTLPISGDDGEITRLTSDGAVIDAATLTPIEDFRADPGPTTDMIVWTLTDDDIGTYSYTCRITGHVAMTGKIEVIAADEPCLADVNGDGMVTPTDFTAWVGAFNSNAPECDQNGDGMCTPTDFSAWVGNYNAGC